jgi:3-mercaptopyruvate sulfurtransferase SseA
MQITREERDALWDHLVNDLTSVGDLALVLSNGDQDAAQRLHQRHIQDVQLLDHIGWQQTHHQQQTFDLPTEHDDDLAHTIQRLGISAAAALANALQDIDFDAIQRLNLVCRTGARATPRT